MHSSAADGELDSGDLFPKLFAKRSRSESSGECPVGGSHNALACIRRLENAPSPAGTKRLRPEISQWRRQHGAPTTRSEIAASSHFIIRSLTFSYRCFLDIIIVTDENTFIVIRSCIFFNLFPSSLVITLPFPLSLVISETDVKQAGTKSYQEKSLTNSGESVEAKRLFPNLSDNYKKSHVSFFANLTD